MKLVYVTDREEIVGLEDVVRDICQRAYEPIGGFKSLRHKKDIRACALLKIVWSADAAGKPAIGACALYKSRDGGFRGIGYAGNKGVVPDYRECTEAIIQDDIAHYDGWYWTEASGAIEHYFEKHGGYAIPNTYVADITKRPLAAEDLLEDGFRYRVRIGTGEDAVEEAKQLFGFANSAVFDRLMDEYGDLGKFTEHVRRLKAGKEPMPEKMGLDAQWPEGVRTALWYIYNLEDCVQENYLNEVPKDWLDLLEFAIEFLKSSKEAHKATILEGIALGEVLQERLAELKLNVIHCRPPMPHSVI